MKVKDQVTKDDIAGIVQEVIKSVFGKTIEELKAQTEQQMEELRKGLFEARQAKTKALKQDKGINIARFVKSMAAAKGSPSDALAYSRKWYGEDDVVTKALLAGDFVSGGATVPPDFRSEIIELLRPASVVRRLSPNIVDMPNGSLTLPKQTGGSTANYVGESQDITESQPSTGDLKLVYKKLVALVPISNDLIRFGTGDTLVRDDIVAGIATREDVAFIRDDGTQDTPKGLRYWAPAANVIPANATINLTNVTTDLAKLLLALEEADVRMLRPAWLFAPRTKNYLMTVRDGNGNYAFREEMLGGSLWGFPYAVSTNVPTNLGSGSDESEVYFVDMADAIIGEAERLIIDASGEATYVSGGQLVSAFSRDQTVIRAITEHDFGMRHDASIAVLTAVKWSP